MAAHDRQTFAAGYPESTAAVEITVRRDNDELCRRGSWRARRDSNSRPLGPQP